MRKRFFVDCENLQSYTMPLGCSGHYITSQNCARHGDIHINASGKNCLDYVLVSVLVSELNYDDIFIIVSKDIGYDSIIDEYASKGYLICRSNGTSIAHIPERFLEYVSFVGVSKFGIRRFTAKLVELYKLRLDNKLTTNSIKSALGSNVKVGEVENMLGRAKNLKYTVETFISICEGLIADVDPSFKLYLLRTMQSCNIDPNGKLAN